MDNSVLVAIITGALAAIPALVSVILSSRLTIYRITQLEDKVQKHNHLVERMAIAERDIKSAFMRIDELRERK